MLYECYIADVFAKSPTNTTAIEVLQEFKYNLHNKKDEKIFQQELESFCLEKNICFKCGNELSVETSKQWSEYFGFPAYEEIDGKLFCKECGYSKKLE